MLTKEDEISLNTFERKIHRCILEEVQGRRYNLFKLEQIRFDLVRLGYINISRLS